MTRAELIRTALGDQPADLVLRGGVLVNVFTRELVPADVVVAGDRIAAVGSAHDALITDTTVVIDLDGQFVAPGLIDPHIHIESSNLTVTELARAIVPRGVLSLCADPHEIANVLGLPGVDLLFAEAAGLPLNLFLRVPGRVPALPAHLETSGHSVDVAGTRALLERPEAVCLGGDINPGLLLGADPDQLAKIEACVELGKTVGGQLPGFFGAALNASIAAGLEDTHVAESVDEVIEQLRRGLRVLLTPRIDRLPAEEWPELAGRVLRDGLDTRNLVLCTDDIHPNVLWREGHLDERVRLLIRSGFPPVQAIQMATINTADLLRIDRDLGAVAPGRRADMVVLDDLTGFRPSLVVHGGRVVARGAMLVDEPAAFAYPGWSKNTIRLRAPVVAADLAIPANGEGPTTVNVVEFGGPKTMRTESVDCHDGVLIPDVSRGIDAIAVLERHHATGLVGRGFVSAMGIRGGAVASTVNHDSHNIFVVGDDYESMAVAANALAEAGGGYVAVVGTEVRALLALPIAGLMTERPLAEVAADLDAVERVLIEELGCTIPYRPVYALNFLCLPNIPDVGVTDRGVILTATMEIAPTVIG